MNMRVEKFPKYRMAYVRQVGPYGPGNIEAMEKLKEWAQEKNLLVGSAILFAIPQDNPAITLPQHCRFDACIVIPDDYPMDEDLSESEFPGGNYVVCTVRHTAEDIQQAWADIIPYVQNHGYEIADKPVFERYTGELISQDYCEICVPVNGIC